MTCETSSRSEISLPEIVCLTKSRRGNFDYISNFIFIVTILFFTLYIIYKKHEGEMH